VHSRSRTNDPGGPPASSPTGPAGGPAGDPAGGPIPQLDLKPQHDALQARIESRLRAVFSSGQFIGGPEVEGLEREFAALCGVPHGVAVSSGTDALRFALLAAAPGSGAAEVITSPLTFIATTEAITQAGARFVFADIDPARFTLDPAAVERALTPRTRAIVPVHLYGQPADMDPITALAHSTGAAVVEDACQAHGAQYHGRAAGALGAAGCFSFYPTKNLGGCGEGGLVTTADAAVAARVRRLRDHGQSEKYLHAEEGYNGRMDALQAAILRVKLPHLAAWNERRRALAARYLDGLADLERAGRLVLPREAPGARHVWHQFSIRIPEHPAGTPHARDAVRAALRDRGIDAGVHYPVPLHLQPCYAALGLGPGSFPHAERAAREVLSLPMYPDLTDARADRVIETLRAVLLARPAPPAPPAARPDSGAARPGAARPDGASRSESGAAPRAEDAGARPDAASRSESGAAPRAEDAGARPGAGGAGESRFSVIIPTYNRADMVTEAVESVLAQTHRDFEIIVVDDGSTDDTTGALAPWRGRVRYVHQANAGLAAARNRGIREATGDFVAFLDSDDLFEPRLLERVLATFRARPEAGAVFVAEREFGNGAGPAAARLHKKETPGLTFTPAGLIGRDTGVGSGRPPVIRRAWLDRLGGFDETMRCAVDSEMWIRYSFQVRMVYLPEPLVRRRVHSGNLSRDRAADAADWLRILDRLRRDHPDFPRRHPLVWRRTLGKHHLRLGAALLARGASGPIAGPVDDPAIDATDAGAASDTAEAGSASDTAEAGRASDTAEAGPASDTAEAGRASDTAAARRGGARLSAVPRSAEQTPEDWPLRARRHLLRSIRSWPLFGRAYAYLIWSLVVPTSFRRWRRWSHRDALGQSRH
jgi:dTDP-4-amino-4,6-dideoxygalactose transaminase/glycosyltransferase involved in cell wall biosynthesis